jgi:hypothetical protein
MATLICPFDFLELYPLGLVGWEWGNSVYAWQDIGHGVVPLGEYQDYDTAIGEWLEKFGCEVGWLTW